MQTSFLLCLAPTGLAVGLASYATPHRVAIRPRSLAAASGSPLHRPWGNGLGTNGGKLARIPANCIAWGGLHTFLPTSPGPRWACRESRRWQTGEAMATGARRPPGHPLIASESDGREVASARIGAGSRRLHMGGRPLKSGGGRLSRQRVGEFDDLLEGRSILEREGRYRDPARAHPPVHVEAARLGVFRTGALAIDLLRRYRHGLQE